MSRLIKIQTEKAPRKVIEEIKKKAPDFDFIIRELFNMANEFKNHGVKIQENFIYYSIMLCNPKKAYESILEDPLRGALLLLPKQIVIYKGKESKKTIIAYAAMEESDIKKLLPEDNTFQKGLSKSCNNIIKLIEEVI